ncbi:hypothetical protein MPNTM1_01962 [Mycolicibacterium parafortuitum]|uniref:right-handed parallel beta-helix repeat-containing protein n=1 Tax=Mycolicibacterium parafortuitum TaxID=39692 RepID=UPI0032C44AD7
MAISRRRLLLAAPAVLAVASACAPRSRGRTVVNVRDHGAVGDGVADDSAAISAAVDSLQPGSTLYFPAGSYRFAELSPQRGAAIRVDGISDLEFEFDADAELLMDNVDPTTNQGTGHGIVIHGPATDITFRNVTIRWADRPTRSAGDGIRILGCPTDSDEVPVGWEGPPTPVSNVRLLNCAISRSAQTGAILIGVSDIEVSGLRVTDTAADGLHFNACRRVKVDDYIGTNNGDDGLALVTYFNEQFYFDSAAETFAFPELTGWSNADVTATNIAIHGGQANGTRIAGANGVSISGFTVIGKGSGVQVDSATPESDPKWHYVASRGVRLSALELSECNIGIQVLARPPAASIDARFTDFDIEVADALIRNSTIWGVRVESLTDQPVTGLRVSDCTVEAISLEGGNGGVGLGYTRDIGLGNMTVSHGLPATVVSVEHSTNLRIGRLAMMFNGSLEPGQPLAPCAKFFDSDGVIDSVDANWPDAPPEWTPILISQADNGCTPDLPLPPLPVEIGELSVKPPSILRPISTC